MKHAQAREDLETREGHIILLSYSHRAHYKCLHKALVSCWCGNKGEKVEREMGGYTLAKNEKVSKGPSLEVM